MWHFSHEASCFPENVPEENKTIEEFIFEMTFMEPRSLLFKNINFYLSMKFIYNIINFFYDHILNNTLTKNQIIIFQILEFFRSIKRVLNNFIQFYSHLRIVIYNLKKFLRKRIYFYSIKNLKNYYPFSFLKLSSSVHN
jgi:hypothetical protein